MAHHIPWNLRVISHFSRHTCNEESATRDLLWKCPGEPDKGEGGRSGEEKEMKSGSDFCIKFRHLSGPSLKLWSINGTNWGPGVGLS